MTTMPSAGVFPQPVSYPRILRGLVPGELLLSPPSSDHLDLFRLDRNSTQNKGGLRHVVRDHVTGTMYFGSARDFYPLASKGAGTLQMGENNGLDFEFFQASGMVSPLELEYDCNCNPQRIVIPLKSSATLSPIERLPEGARFYAEPELQVDGHAFFVDHEGVVHLLKVLFSKNPDITPEVIMQTGSQKTRLEPHCLLPNQLDYALNEFASLIVRPAQQFFDLWCNDKRAFLSFLTLEDMVF